MKNLFIDCGTNLGQGLKQFDKKMSLLNNDKWDVYTFDPNPHINVMDMFPGVSNLTKVDKAIWIADISLTFLCKGKNTEELRQFNNEGRFQGGGSMIADDTFDNHNKFIPSHVEVDTVTVSAINFSEFIKERHNLYDKIVVKMDIEGAEFKVIDHMIQNDTLKYIDEIYVEPHGRFEFKPHERHLYVNEIKQIEDELILKCKTHVNKTYLWT